MHRYGCYYVRYLLTVGILDGTSMLKQTKPGVFMHHITRAKWTQDSYFEGKILHTAWETLMTILYLNILPTHHLYHFNRSIKRYKIGQRYWYPNFTYGLFDSFITNVRMCFYN